MERTTGRILRMVSDPLAGNGFLKPIVFILSEIITIFLLFKHDVEKNKHGLHNHNLCTIRQKFLKNAIDFLLNYTVTCKTVTERVMYLTKDL